MTVATSTIKLKPCQDRIVVLPIKPAETTETGILLPESAREEKKNKGTVVAAGEGRRTDKGELLPMYVSIGDTVYYSRFGGGEPYDEDGVDYIIFRQSDIIGIL